MGAMWRGEKTTPVIESDYQIANGKKSLLCRFMDYLGDPQARTKDASGYIPLETQMLKVKFYSPIYDIRIKHLKKQDTD